MRTIIVPVTTPRTNGDNFNSKEMMRTIISAAVVSTMNRSFSGDRSTLNPLLDIV